MLYLVILNFRQFNCMLKDLFLWGQLIPDTENKR